MDLGALVLLFALIGLTFMAATILAARARLAFAIAAVVCFGIAVILDLVVLVGK
jgi:hypothetical protein